jgi:hypothetical protein
MTTPHSPANVRSRDGLPLADAIVGLAGTPVHASGIEARLTTIARLAVARVAAADYASVTTLRGDEYTTLAASDDIAAAVDEAQIADRAGPCLQALATGEPVAVPDTSATMQWPGFHEVAPGLGLEASVSMPLFAGWGAPIAALNLYGRDSAAMTPLIIGVAAVYAARRGLRLDGEDAPIEDPGAEELITGYAGALAVRATVQLAVDLLAGMTGGADDEAYAALCVRAAEADLALPAAAEAVIRENL